MSTDDDLRLDRLKSAFERPNPVTIAGYGHESTHKGYLTWILSENHWPKGAAQACLALCRLAYREISIPSTPSELSRVQTVTERALGKKRKVDLLTRFESRGVKYAVPIELKTDSEPGSSQFADMSSGSIVDGSVVARIALLLGASSVMRFPGEGNAFKSLTPHDLYDGLTPLSSLNCGFLNDWLTAVKEESERHVLALAAYRAARGDNFRCIPQWGYRSIAHLMYYTYDRIRQDLSKHIPGSEWDIYSGGYNAVMNLGPESSFWIQLPRPGVKAFFEFNDEYFVLKIHAPLADESYGGREIRSKLENELRPWVKSIRERAERDNAGLPPIERPRSNRFNKEWLTVLKWKIDFCEPEVATGIVQEILRKCANLDFLSKRHV